MASIRERGSKFMVTWREQGRQRGKTYRTREEAEALAATVEQKGAPAAQNHGTTLAAYSDRYLAAHRLSDEARRMYKMIIRNYLIPAFGGPMDAVTPADIRCFLRELESRCTGAMVRKVKTVGSSVWHDALDEELVRFNPWHGQRCKPDPVKPPRILTPAEFKLVLDAFDSHYRLLIRTLGESGLRWSEAMRLLPGDIDGDVIRVRVSKNGKSRSVQVDHDLAGALRARLPFRTPAGGVINYGCFRRTKWGPVTEGMNVTIHDLRHSHASWLLAAGADLVTVRDRLGHGDISITSRYLHTLPGSQDAALDALRRALAA